MYLCILFMVLHVLIALLVCEGNLYNELAKSEWWILNPRIADVVINVSTQQYRCC